MLWNRLRRTLADHPMFQIMVFLASGTAVSGHGTSGTLEQGVFVASSVVADASAVH